MRPRKRYIAVGRALRVQKRTGLLIADPYDTWEKETARLNEAGRALDRFAMKRLNGREYNKAAGGTAALDPFAFAFLIPRGVSSIELIETPIPETMESVDEVLLETALEILQERGANKISTEALIRAFVERGGPWVGRWGPDTASGNIARPARHLADRLRLYGIRSRTIRIGSSVRKGYRIGDLRSGLSRYQRAQDSPNAGPATLRVRTVRPNPGLVNRVLRRVGVLGTFVQRLNTDREFLKEVLQHLDPRFRYLQESLKRLRSGEGFPIRFSALPVDLRIGIDTSREAMGIRVEVHRFEQAAWRLHWCRHKGHLYASNGYGRLPIDCPAHRYAGRKARSGGVW